MATSFKGLAAEGMLKKADKYRAKVVDLKVEEGFNLRVEGAELEEHIDSMVKSILAGITMPPIECRIGDDGTLLIVDGHCRRRAYLRAIEQGAEIEYVDILPFFGNDVDRVAKMIASSQGKSLTMLEQAMGFKRLASFGWEPEKIASTIGKTRTHIDNLLILAYANNDVHQLVSVGAVSATMAIEVVREHGEKAGEFLKSKLDASVSKGKAKVTKAAIAGKAIPKKVVGQVISSLDSFASKLSPATAQALNDVRDLDETKLESTFVKVEASALLELLKAGDGLAAVRAKQAQSGAEPKQD